MPRLRAKGYMDALHQPAGVIEEQKRRLEEEKKRAKKFPEQPAERRAVFLIEHAPLERWQRDVLEIVRDEAYYFAPQAMTKIMNKAGPSTGTRRS